MADDGTDSPFGATPTAPTAQSIYPADSGATNVELATQFLGRHNADIAKRQPDIDNTLSRMQMTTDTMTKMLDDTTSAIKASRQGRVNMPLLAMGAGMLSGTGNFGTQLGAGLQAMIPQIHNDRKEEDDTNLQLAQLALRRGALEQLPLEKKLDYMKALQLGDLGSVKAIEQALIRAQSKTGGADKAAADAAKLMQKTVQQALEEARKSVAQENTEMYATDADRKQAIRERFIQNIKTHQAAGIPIPQAVVDQVMTTMQTDAGGAAGVAQKSFVEAPNSPDVTKRAVEAGLPPPPPTYDPSALGQKQRTELFKTNAAQFAKESKDWDEQAKAAADLSTDIERAEAILNTKRGKEVVGPQHGIPNKYITNYSDEAQKLEGIFTKMQLHGIPKGQGAVSNMERDLFAMGSANMGVDAAANLDILKVQKQIIQRDKDRRSFFTDYYNHYRTTDGAVQQWERYINSPAGNAVIPRGSKLVPNESRVPYKEYFASQWPQAKRDGGAIKLGREYD